MKFTALLAVLSALGFLVAACGQEKGYGLLVAEYTSGSTAVLFKTKVKLPSPEEGYRFSYELRNGERTCTLSGELDIKETPSEDECPGTKGKGKIACNDGKPMKIRWELTSCQAGYGQAKGKGDRKFFFGFERNKERALDQLDKIKRGE